MINVDYFIYRVLFKLKVCFNLLSILVKSLKAIICIISGDIHYIDISRISHCCCAVPPHPPFARKYIITIVCGRDYKYNLPINN